jgi:hypothetical protein
MPRALLGQLPDRTRRSKGLCPNKCSLLLPQGCNRVSLKRLPSVSWEGLFLRELWRMADRLDSRRRGRSSRFAVKCSSCARENFLRTATSPRKLSSTR